MREDGTILHRQLTLADKKTILDIIRKDINRPEENAGLLNFIYGCITAFLLAIGFHYLYRRQIKVKQKQELTHRQISELELRAICSQMNPHFIFNALSSIQNLINSSANKEAGDYLVNFSRLLRMVLATSEKKLVSLSEEIEQIQLYLKLEQLRFPFSYSFSIDKNIEPELIEIPGLPLQDGGFGIRAISSQFEILKTLYNTGIGITIENRQDKEYVSGCHVRLSIPL